MFTRRVARLATVVTSAMLAGMLLGVSGAEAKTPDWSMTVESLPSTVGPNSIAAYQVTISNDGKSNISKLYLGASISDHLAYSSTKPNSNVPWCPVGVALNCSLGSLRRTVIRSS